MLLCEFVLNSTRSPRSEDVIYHTLLQLYLAPEPAAGQPDADSAPSVSPAARRWLFHPCLIDC